MELSTLLTKLLIFFTLMLIGYLYARSGKLSDGFAASAGKLTLNVFLTATILNSVFNLEMNFSGREIAIAMLVLTVCICLPYPISFIIGRFVPLRAERQGVFELLCAVPNTGFFALPLLQELLGAQAVFYFTLSTIPFNLMLFSYGAWRLESGKGGKINLCNAFSMPFFGGIAALILIFTGLPVPRIFKELAGAMSGATMPLSMLVVGSSMAAIKPLDIFKEKSLYLTSLARLVVIPLIVFFITGLLTKNPSLLATVAVISCCPAASAITPMCYEHGAEAAYASGGMMMQTLFSFVTIPLLLAVLI